MSAVLVAAFYKFAHLPDFAQLKEPLTAFCERRAVKGTILLAKEGVNGTIAGLSEDVRAVLDWLRADARLADLEHKESSATQMPFYRMKVRLKREIVTLGAPHADPAKAVGQYVKPEEWHRLLDDPSVVLIDVRNDYEVAIGTFPGALDPGTRSFRELPAWLEQQAVLRDKPKVAMFCTGGIRCEKSTALLRAQGFEQVFHLQGGILKYLETVPQEQSRWLGQCFVFDERVSVGHGLQPGDYELCRACRLPVGDVERAAPQFVRGVSCPRCYERTSAVKKASLRERQRQVEIARGRDLAHIGQRLPPKKSITEDSRQRGDFVATNDNDPAGRVADVTTRNN